MKFVDVNPDEIDNLRQGRRGRVSYPLLKGFLETGKFLVKIDRTGIQQSLQTLSSSLNTYIRNHHLPIKIFQRSGEMYLMRLDVDRDGNAIPDWEEKLVKEKLQQANEDEELLDADSVTRNSTVEKDKVTK